MSQFVDLERLLQRRRIPVEVWIEENGIVSIELLDEHLSENGISATEAVRTRVQTFLSRKTETEKLQEKVLEAVEVMGNDVQTSKKSKKVKSVVEPEPECYIEPTEQGTKTNDHSSEQSIQSSLEPGQDQHTEQGKLSSN